MILSFVTRTVLASLLCSPLLPLSRAQTVAPTPVPLTKFVPADRFTVPAGFELTVWAQAPQLRNPTNMDVDAQG